MNELDRLGGERKRLMAKLDALEPALHEAMRAARKMEPQPSQQDIMDRSGYRSLVTVRKILGEGDQPPGRPRKKVTSTNEAEPE